VHIQWKLIAKYISQECTKEERRLIQARIQTDQVFSKLIKTLQTSTNLNKMPSRPIDVDALWQEFLNRTNTEKHGAIYREHVPSGAVPNVRHSKRMHPLLKIAAMLLLTISLAYLVSKEIKFTSENSFPKQKYETLTINNGERLNISLIDGSHVTVDAGSEFRYFTSYEDERHVYLKGEACFNISQDSERPFYVHVGNAIVRVVGTRFNVRAWNINPEVIVTVAEGKVMVGPDDSVQTDLTMLKQGPQSTITARGAALSEIIKVDAEKYFKWMQNEIFFENAEVKEVVAQLERWYDLKYEFEDEQALEEELTVHIRWANIDEVNRVISLVTDTNIVRDGKLIRFIKKESKQ
jgi:ferric-dicitrate binding protein FerR (iron transport regulator)